MNRALSSCVVYFCLAFAFGKNEDTHTLHKRLLLNDPDIAATRLANVEAAVQLLKGTVSKLEAGLQAEKNKNAEHEINISQMTSTLKKLQGILLLRNKTQMLDISVFDRFIKPYLIHI